MIRVKGAVFSVTPPLPEEYATEYLRWHLLDHQPEQYQLPGLVLSQRWIADGEYLSSRIVGDSPLGNVGNIVNYLIGDPVQQTYDDFMELGPRLREIGRFPYRAPSLQVRLLGLLKWYASRRALISPEVVPFRPHHGVLVIIEEPVGGGLDDWLRWLHTDHHPAVLGVGGVVGAWMYGTVQTWRLHPTAEGGPQYVTVVYLEEDPIAATQALAPIVEERWASGAVRPLFAGPLRTMVHWDAWPG
ncbi:MAG TPA: hypothetical protein VMU14_14625 [Acidimicrobiales bacterium]|nr:hypothetical protein [Acidimicrobiales bacterium]